jgi:hypothetical protein
LFWGTTTPLRGALLVISVILRVEGSVAGERCNGRVSRSLMMQRSSGLRTRGVEPRAVEVEESWSAVKGCRCVKKPAEASKSAASVDEKVAGLYLRAGIQGGMQLETPVSRRKGSASRFE